MSQSKLENLFNPKSVAVVGASRREGSIGYMVVKGLLDGGFEGKIYPINPKADQILGIKCYPSILDVPDDDISFAVIVVPQKLVLDVVEQCGKKGVGGVAVISSGFGEVGNVEAERKLREICDRYGMWLIGPNIVGILNNPAKCNASFAPYLPYPGGISLVSQSGALLIGIDGLTWIKKIGIAHMISHGNMAGLTFADFIEALDQDPNTKAIGLYIEGFKEGRRVIQVARRSKKPIVALKAGVSQRGFLAAASHTGSLAGSPKVYESIFKQAGIIPARSLTDLFDRASALALQRPLASDRVLIITNGGGAGVLGTDAAERYGVPLQDPPEDLKDAMRKWMPDFGSPRNPVDLTGMGNRENYSGALRDALQHPWVDGVVVLYCETAQTDPMEIAKGIVEVIEETRTQKPVVVSYIGGERSIKAGEWLVSKGIPFYDDPDAALSAMGALRERARFLERVKAEGEAERPEDVDKAKAKEIMDRVKAEGRLALTEYEAGMVFRAYGLPYADSRLARTPDEAVAAAQELGYPVVLKISSPDILHKTEAGGIRVGLGSPEQVRKAFEEIMERAKAYKPEAQIHGILVQKMAPGGAVEVILGGTRDPQFGPLVMFGLGGVFVEVLRDVSFRAAPFSKAEAQEMLTEIKGYPLLQGFRGSPARDTEALADALVRLGTLMEDFPEIAELDANPTMSYPDGLIIVDALIKLGEPKEKSKEKSKAH